MELWWKNKDIVTQIVSWAYDLQKAYPKNRILSLGQSPAWIVQSVGMLRKLRGHDANITFIPFTGAFLSRDYEEDSEAMAFAARPEARPDINRLSRYFTLLGRLEARPEQIEAEPEKVVLAEMIKSGNGLASFLDIWTSNQDDAALEAFLNKLEIYAYDTNTIANLDALSIGERTFPIKRVALSLSGAELMEGITPNNRAEPTSSRLVAMYKLSAQAEEKGIELIPNKEIRFQIRQDLHGEIQRREQDAQRSRANRYG